MNLNEVVDKTGGEGASPSTQAFGGSSGPCHPTDAGPNRVSPWLQGKQVLPDSGKEAELR